MKSLLIFAGAFFFWSAEARFFLKPSPIVEVKKEAPLFVKPSASSMAIADVPVGTLALARQLSPNRTWVLLEDSDGVQGWFPTNRSNLAAVAPRQVGSMPNQLLSNKSKGSSNASLDRQNPAPLQQPSSLESLARTKPDAEKERDEPSKSASSLRREFALATQWPNFPSASALYGFHLSYVERQMPMSLGIRGNVMFSTEAGLWSWGIGFLSRWPWGQNFYREMEVGFQQLRLSAESQNSVQLSYGAGMVLSNRWLADIRGGLRGFSDSQWFLGCRLTYLF